MKHCARRMHADMALGFCYGVTCAVVALAATYGVLHVIKYKDHARPTL